MHTAHRTPHAARRTPHAAHRTPHTAHCTPPHAARRKMCRRIQPHAYVLCIGVYTRGFEDVYTTCTQSTYFTFLPPQAIRELQKLCDAVAPYPTADAIRMVEFELGSKVSELFDGLDGSTTPIAAASLGQ